MALDRYGPTLAALAAYQRPVGGYAALGFLVSVAFWAVVNGAIVAAFVWAALLVWRRHRRGRAHESRPPSGDERPADDGWR